MIKALNDADFQKEVIDTKEKAMVDLTAQWCGPCKALAPVIEELANENANKIKVYKMDIDNSPDTPVKYNVMSVPTLLFFNNGQIVDQVIGLVPKQSIQDKIDSI